MASRSGYQQRKDWAMPACADPTSGLRIVLRRHKAWPRGRASIKFRCPPFVITPNPNPALQIKLPLNWQTFSRYQIRQAAHLPNCTSQFVGSLQQVRDQNSRGLGVSEVMRMPAVEALLMLLHKLSQLRVPYDSIFQELVLLQL